MGDDIHDRVARLIPLPASGSHTAIAEILRREYGKLLTEAHEEVRAAHTSESEMAAEADQQIDQLKAKLSKAREALRRIDNKNRIGMATMLRQMDDVTTEALKEIGDA